MLVVFGVVLGVIDAVARNEKPLARLTMRDALIYGGAQALALVPGVSRSGGTTGAGLLMGYRREAAARYSFLLAIPAVLVSGIFELRKIGDGEPVDWGPTILATCIAFVVGLTVIVYFLRHLDAQLPAVRRLPDRAGPGRPRAARGGGHRHLTSPVPRPPRRGRRRAMTVIGVHASHEQVHVRAAGRRAARRRVGFTAAMCSDHFSPWGSSQGQSGFAWSWLGAALQATRLPFGVVNAPGQRYHPAVIAQAVGTLEAMFPGRFWVALGTGEASNEHITGGGWPRSRSATPACGSAST